MNRLLSLPFGHMANQAFWSDDVQDSVLKCTHAYKIPRITKAWSLAKVSLPGGEKLMCYSVNPP